MLFGFIRTNLRVFLLLLHLLPSLSFKLLIRFEQFFILFQTFATCRICNVFFQIYIYIIFLSRKKEYKSASCIAWFLRLLFGFNWNFKRILCRKKKKEKKLFVKLFHLWERVEKIILSTIYFFATSNPLQQRSSIKRKKKKRKIFQSFQSFPQLSFYQRFFENWNNYAVYRKSSGIRDRP